MNANEIPMTILQLAAVPLLVLLNGFFVAAEFALVKIRDTQLEDLVVGDGFDEEIEVCTVSGLMSQRLGRFPRVGDAVPFGAWELRVEELVGTRVARMKLSQKVESGGRTYAETPTGPAGPRPTQSETAEQNQLASTSR